MLTTEILKQQIGSIQTKLNFKTVEPFARIAERWFRDQVGRELVAHLAGLTNPGQSSPAPGSDDAELLELTHACMSWRAYELAFPHVKLQVGDLGITKTPGSNGQVVSKWEYADSREANLAMLDLCLENFWQAIEQIRPAAWLASAAYQKRQRVFIRTATELAEHVPTLGRNSRLFDQLITYVGRAELKYIRPALTYPVYSELKAAWSNPDAELTPEQQTLLELLRPALAHYAVYEAYPYLPLTIGTMGVSESRAKDGLLEQVAPDKDDKNTQKLQLHKDGLFYLNELETYLQATATEELFPSYYQAHQVTPGQDSTIDCSNSTLIIL
jgi:hypothetical protein